MEQEIQNILDFLTNTKESIGNENIIYILLVFILFILFLNFLSRRKIIHYVEKIPSVEINRSIQDKLAQLESKISQLEIYNQESIFRFGKIKDELKNIIKIETIKYNPYEDMGVGGKQSFSTALVDGSGNGTILTCLYSRERTRVMTKIIKNFEPEQELSPEEKEVLKKIKDKNHS